MSVPSKSSTKITKNEETSPAESVSEDLMAGDSDSDADPFTAHNTSISCGLGPNKLVATPGCGE